MKNVSDFFWIGDFLKQKVASQMVEKKQRNRRNLH